MKLQSLSGYVLATAVAGVLAACSKKDNTPDPCAGVDYAINYYKTEAIGTAQNGSIIVLAPVGDTLSYQLDNGNFQSSPLFSNLAPGNYVLRVRNNVRGCTDTAQVSILNYGPKYAQVKQIITGYCGPCHLNGGNSGNMNFDSDTRIVNAWDRIKARAVDNLPSPMPEAPNAPLTAPDKQKITDWVNAGHRLLD